MHMAILHWTDCCCLEYPRCLCPYVSCPLVAKEKASATFVFTHFNTDNNDGIKSGIYIFVLGLLMSQYTLSGYDASAHKKKLDLTLKVVGGDISAIPGLYDAIVGTIRDAIEDSIMWPVRKIIPILPGDYSHLELKPVGMLEVKLVQAKELTNKDLIGKSDPFAVLYVRPTRDRIKTSKTINNQLNPIWNEHFEFIVEDKSSQHLVVKVFDDEGLQAAELIGCAQL